jgi:DNA-directed RNA polymerase specialized sigma24 family protein
MRWSVVLACADSAAGEATARKALTELCKTYWRPVFAFICRRGYSVPDAQDLTQDFFLMILERDILKRADPNRGRFRSLRHDVSYQKLSKILGVPEASVKRLVHKLRVRYRDLLRAEVAQTVEQPQDVDDELRYLCAALSAATA